MKAKINFALICFFAYLNGILATDNTTVSIFESEEDNSDTRNFMLKLMNNKQRILNMIIIALILGILVIFAVMFLVILWYSEHLVPFSIFIVAFLLFCFALSLAMYTIVTIKNSMFLNKLLEQYFI